MAVLLEDLVPSLMREVSPPGTDLFPDATEAEYIGYLSDALYYAILDGVLTDYESDGTQITPIAPVTDDLSPELQHLLVLYAAIRIITADMRRRETLFRAKAGPVEYETQQSATLLRDILAEMIRRLNLILTRLSDLGRVDGYYVDMVTARGEAIMYGYTPFFSNQGI